MSNYKPSYEGKNPKDINLLEMINVIKKRIWIVFLITILFGSAGFAYTKLNSSPLYQSSTRIIVGANPELMLTLQVIIKDPTVLGKVVEQLKLDRSPESLAGQISVESIEGSQVVSINVTDTDPQVAADIANTTARVFKEEVPKIVEFNDIRFLSDAKVNPFPINGNQNKKIIFAIIFGIAVGIGLIFLLESFDNTVRSEREIEELLEIPVMGKISKMNKKNIKKKGQSQLEYNLRGETSVSK